MTMHRIVEPGTRWNAHNSTIKELLGLKRGDKLPAAGMPAQQIQGYKVWVEPAPPPLYHYGRYGGPLIKVKSSKHRIMVECPYCTQVMSVGRLHQHKCKE